MTLPRPATLLRAPRELWRTARGPLLGLAVLAMLALVAHFAYRGFNDWRAASRAEAEEATVSTAAQHASTALAVTFSSLVNKIDTARLAEIVQGGDPAAMVEAERGVAASDPRVLSARLLPAGEEDVDYETHPPLSYAALEMLSQSQASGKAPPPEALLLGTPDQHVAIVQRLTAGDALVGHLLLAVDVGVLAGAFAGISLDGGYAELVQQVPRGARLTLAVAGKPARRAGPPAAERSLTGTGWRLAYWSPHRERAEAGEAAGPPLPVVGAAVGALVGLLALVVMRRRRRARAPVQAPPPPAPRVPPPPPPTQLAVDGIEVAYEGDEDAAQEARAPDEAGAPADAAPDESRPALPASIFRAYDVRGIVGKTLDADIVRLLGRAIGSEAEARGQQTLVVGHDGRTSGPELLEALVEGLRASGRDVIDIGRVPTPVLYFATYYLNTGSGVIVTGSHNPAEYNGLKIMLGGETLFGEAVAALRDRAQAEDFTTGEGGLQHMDVVPEYIRRISEDVPVALGSAFKVVVDCGNAVPGEVVPKLLRALGHDVVELYCEMDGRFPNHHPDPSVPANLQALIEAVAREGADLGLAFDGDGDRLGVVDAAGTIIWPDRQLMLYARDLLARNPGATIVFDVKSSSRLPRVIEKLGGVPIMWKSGHSFMKDKMHETGALLAAEMSGHIFFKERWYGFDDALYAAARLLEILLGLKLPPNQVFSKLPYGVATPELRIDLAEGEPEAVMEKLCAAAPFADATLVDIDGLRAEYADGWGLVRASHTTPSLVLRFEADDEAALVRVKDRFREALLAVDGALALPF